MTTSIAGIFRSKFQRVGIMAVVFTLALNCGTAVFAQGLINFLNNASTHVTLSSNGVNIGSTPAGAPGTFRYELFIAPAGTVNPASFTATGVIATNITAAGRLSGGANRAVPGTLLGGTGAILVRGWSANLGSTYAAAVVAYQIGGNGYIGESAIAPNFLYGGDGGSGTIPASSAFGGSVGITSGFVLYSSLPIYNPPLGYTLILSARVSSWGAMLLFLCRLVVPLP